MSEHSKFSPSGAERWLTCPGSLDLPGEDKNSVYAQEGTAAHELAHQCCMLGGSPYDRIGDKIGEFEVTREMADAIQVYLDTIQVKYDQLLGTNKQIDLEIRLIHPDHPDFGGTIDCLISSSVSFKIVDFKYGAGVPVDVPCNEQLSCYAALAKARYDAAGATCTADCELTVVQPRAQHKDGPVRSWACDMAYLDSFMLRVQEVMSGRRAGELKAGDHCRWCPAKASCPELMRYTLEMAKEEFSADEMTPEKASKVLSVADSILAYVDTVRQWAHGQMDKGVHVPGWKLVATYRNRRYCVDEDVIVRRCRSRGIGKKLIYDMKLKSPAQLEKVVGKNLVAEFAEKPPNGTTIARESDSRKAVERKSAAEEFTE